MITNSRYVPTLSLATSISPTIFPSLKKGQGMYVGINYVGINACFSATSTLGFYVNIPTYTCTDIRIYPCPLNVARDDITETVYTYVYIVYI